MPEENKKFVTNLTIVLCLLVIVYLPCFYELTESWITNPDYSHGFLVLPISIYFVWMKKDEITLPQQHDAKIGIVLVAIGLILHIFGIYGEISSCSNLSLLVTLLGVLLAILGRENTKKLLFPAFFLIFMFPVPESFYVRATGSLKLLVTGVSADILNLSGIPVFREGNILHFANTSLQVVEACSGIRSIISYSMLGVLFMYLLEKGIMSKLILAVSAFILALLVNILRVCGTGALSHLFGGDIAQGFFHEFSGLILFILGFAILFCVYLLLRRIPFRTRD